jgi:hypothetical protein
MPRKAAFDVIKDALESAGSSINNRLVDLGYLDSSLTTNPTQISRATTRYKNNLKNPGFRNRELTGAQNQFQTSFEKADLGPQVIADLDSLQGSILNAVQGDQSDIGLLSMVGGHPVNVDVQGGYNFPKRYTNQRVGWASNKGQAQGVLQKGRNLQEANPNRDVINIYNAMGAEATNFSVPPTESILIQIQNNDLIPKSVKNDFDKKLRAVYPQWVGLDDPRALDQLTGTGEFAGKAIGKMRTAFVKIAEGAPFESRGFPSTKETIRAINAPELAGSNLGDAGLSMHRLDTSRDIEPSDLHGSYSHIVFGDYVGGTPRSVPFQVMFPDAYETISRDVNKRGAPMKRNEIINAINRRGSAGNFDDETRRKVEGITQIADQKWIDTVNTYLEKGTLPAALSSVGLLGLASGPEAQAAAMYDNISRNAPGSIRAPRSGMAASAANAMSAYNEFAQDPNRSGLLGYLLPTAPADWMRKVAYGDNVSMMDRTGAAAGLLGF